MICALLLAIHAVGIASVVYAVGEEFPAPVGAGADDLRMMVAQGDVERDGAAKAGARPLLPSCDGSPTRLP